MWDIYINTYLFLMAILGSCCVGMIALGIESEGTTCLIIGGVFGILASVVHFITPSEEHMLTKEYEDILAARPECAAVIDKNIDSASLECLREYKVYLVDSAAVAKRYYDHFSALKLDIKR